MKKITNDKIFALCLGDFARGLINGIITTYLLTFFIPTNSNTTLPQFFMKAALTMAIIRGIGTVIDAVTDPWVASLSDNSKAKSGRRISFMRWSAIPYGLFCLLIFFPPVAGSSVINAIWVGVMLALYYLFSTLYNIPYSALQAEVVAEPRKRVFLYSVVSLLYVVSSAMVFCTSMIKSILMKNGIEEIWALRIPFIVFCVLGGIAALIPAFVIKEKDYVEPKEYHQSIWDALKATVSYPNFAIITVGYLIMWIAFTFFNTAEVYYITNLLNLGDEWVTYVSVISIGVGIMTYPLVNILARKVGKKPLLLGACITYVLLYCAIFNYNLVIDAIGAKPFAILIGLVIAMPIAITNIIPSSIFADLAQYDSIKTGQNRAGMFFAARNFANKVWNASRFALMNLDGPADDTLPKGIADKWILTRLNDAIETVTMHLEQFDLAMAAQKLYDFIWSELCDWYLELAKAPLYGDDENAASATRATLKYVLVSTLKLLHPFMPFLTEEIYSYLPFTSGSIMVSSWPKVGENFPQEAAAMQHIMDVVSAVRNLRAGMNVPPSRKAHIYIVPAEGIDGSIFTENESFFQRLASAEGVQVVAREELPRNVVSAVCPCGEAFLPTGELVDVEKEIARLNKEIANMENEIKRAEGKLNNPGFVGKAPANVVQAEREKLTTNKTMLEALHKRLEDMKNL